MSKNQPIPCQLLYSVFFRIIFVLVRGKGIISNSNIKEATEDECKDASFSGDKWILIVDSGCSE
jgi:hypothetical protein